MILRDEDIASGTGGRLVRPGSPGFISTDSRRLAPGQWFLALSGERFDGHDFLPHAMAAGCAGAIARFVPEGWTAGFVQVDDGLQALQSLASWVREGFRGPVVGLTGSAGKTTTRAMIALVLGAGDSTAHKVIHATEGNLNNHVGVPLTILGAPVDADVWVVEMGMNHSGEIHRLQEICRPTVRLVTNVGPAHVEGCGSMEGVARAKGELFAGARPGDVCVVNADDARVASLPIPEGIRVLRYGSQKGVDIRLTDAVVDPVTLATRFRVETPGDGVVRGQLSSPGLHLATNVAAAIAVGVALHVDPGDMAERLARYSPVGMRLRVEDGPLTGALPQRRLQRQPDQHDGRASDPGRDPRCPPGGPSGRHAGVGSDRGQRPRRASLIWPCPWTSNTSGWSARASLLRHGHAAARTCSSPPRHTPWGTPSRPSWSPATWCWPRVAAAWPWNTPCSPSATL